ncbi:Peptidase A1 [Macleaya cordata]|uniref:Peptidase A1 n=1 Tax=Macleaya cordata TaxID=56857 RepID=A0A200QX30_MACCD|nr:Peptidase A1 [Macleaya cordata]
MARITETTLTLYLLSTLFLLLNLVIAGPNGFSMKIFHRDSKESPLYPGDHLTEEERIQRLFQQSKARTRHHISATKLGHNLTGGSIDPDIARLPVSFVGSFYLALIGIGTFQNDPAGEDYKNYYLIVDTASDLIWTQCAGCTSCFHQDKPLFPYQTSSTYRYLPCNQHPLCDVRCARDACAYEQSYANGAITRGILSSERFTVNSDNGAIEAIDDMVFGCGFNQQNFGDYIGHEHEKGRPDEIAGILGLGRGPRSFVTQLRDSAKRKFSYCLGPGTNGRSWSTFLRFGEDAQFPEGVEVYTTPLVLGSRQTFYYVNLNDVTVGDHRIGFPPGSFALNAGTGKGGVMIDSGNPWTIFQKSKYKFVREATIRHFNRSQLVPRKGGYLHFDLCYDKPEGFNNFPVIKFHFDQADFVIEKEAGFYISDSFFCLAMHTDDSYFSAVIGAWQTTNQRIMYDPFNSMLSFAKEECQNNE